MQEFLNLRSYKYDFFNFCILYFKSNEDSLNTVICAYLFYKIHFLWLEASRSLLFGDKKDYELSRSASIA